MDPAGNVKPDRKHSTSRIDPMSALIDAIDAWMRRENGGRSVYEERGLEVAG
jgi:phage terminase large subunit-like protein